MNLPDRLLPTFFLSVSFVFLSLPVFAEPLTGEAEAGTVMVTGNTDSETYNAKGKVTKTQEKNVYSSFGRYLKTVSNGVESARNWEIGARYERLFAEDLGAFVAQKAESDIFNGYTQRDSTDAGLKYTFLKKDDLVWTGELGARYQYTLSVVGDSSYGNLGRLYTEVNKSLDPNLSFKYWIEYLPNFTEVKAYLMNTEASFNAMISSHFSLKVGYLLQYQNLPLVANKYTTTTTTMNLVAKF